MAGGRFYWNSLGGNQRCMKESRRILLVEEDFAEVLLLERAFHHAQIINPIQIARHSDEAICYLKGIGIYGNRRIYPLPSLILLSLKTRTGVGFKLLAWIRSQPQFRGVPIVAIGNIKNADEIQEAYDLGASAYFERRKNESEIVQLIQELEMLEDIWDRCESSNDQQGYP
jgi:CheY-like chemotaxis protein